MNVSNPTANQIRVAINHELSERGGRAFNLEVDLDLPAKGITAVFGESGSGKTTLLRCIAGLETSSRGEIQVRDAVWQSETDVIPPHQRRVGYVFQESSLFPHLNVKKNIAFGISRSPSLLDSQRYDQIIELMGLAPLLQQYPDQLSGGERQRAAIARALIIEPDLLLMDEPLTSLDIKRKQEILPYLESVHEKLDVPIIYVTHSVDEVARLADYLVVLQEGKVIANGGLKEVLSDIELPLQLGEETGVVVEAEVKERDSDWNLIRATFEGGELWIKDSGDEIGHNIRIRILARDVSLALSEHSDTSIINRLRVKVEKIQDIIDQSMLLVSLKAGNSNIIARLSRRSAHHLNINAGMEVWAQIKGVAILR